MLHGIDVSEWQGQLDWRHVRLPGQELAFAFAKSTEGVAEVDPHFAHNWRGIRDAGLRRGAYHYATPHSAGSLGGLRAQATAEAEHMLREIEAAGGLHDGDLPPTLDLEYPSTNLDGAQLHEWVGVWAATIAKHVGRPPIIYTGGFWKERLAGYTDAFGCPLWLAQYGPPVVPRAWRAWTFWQYTDAGHLEGISGSVDLDWFHGDRAELEALTIGADAPHGVDHHEPAHHEPVHHAEPIAAHNGAPPVAAGGTPPWSGRVLREGVRGEDVKEWQEQMRRRGFVDLAADGIFGPQSAESCRWLALYVKEPPTEEVDERLWHATWTAP
jgi:lysozyme